jgi:hypothetical protein
VLFYYTYTIFKSGYYYSGVVALLQWSLRLFKKGLLGLFKRDYKLVADRLTRIVTIGLPQLLNKGYGL